MERINIKNEESSKNKKDQNVSDSDFNNKNTKILLIDTSPKARANTPKTPLAPRHLNKK